MSLSLFKRWGIDPSGGNGINFLEKIATQGHEPFNHYSRNVTLADTNALSLPAAVEGFCLLTDGTDAAVIIVNSDGTVVEGFASTANIDTAGGGNIQPGDLTADDATQIKNTSGSDMDLRVVFFYR